MPYEDRNQDHDEDDDNDAYGSRPAPTAIVDYNRAISHTSHCSFRSSARFIPRVQAGIPGGGEASGMWVWSGFVLSLGLAALAWTRAGARSATFYEGEVYGMGKAGHQKYAIGFSILTAMFLAELLWPGLLKKAAPWRLWWPESLLAYLALTGILYGATFLRGATGEDE